MSRFSASLAIAALALCGFGTAAHAIELGDRFDLHGYGHQDYLQTSGNPYLGADRKGTWDNNFIGLVLATTLDEKSKLWLQLEGATGEGARFTWFFVDYQINDAARAHVGRVKLPLGFYNEIIEVRALQLSALVPSLYQVAADMVHDAYHGAGIDYEQDIAGGHVLWQVWGGNVYDVNPPEDSRDRRAFGGRVTYRTLIDGLRLMASAYRTQVEILADRSKVDEDRVILSAELARNDWELKAEYGHHKFGPTKSQAYYVQGGYTFAGKWTPYLRYDYVTTDQTQRKDPSFYQHTGVAGLYYRFSGNIGLRAEGHVNRGYALPVSSGEVAPGAGSRKWQLYAVSADFAF